MIFFPLTNSTKNLFRFLIIDILDGVRTRIGLDRSSAPSRSLTALLKLFAQLPRDMLERRRLFLRILSEHQVSSCALSSLFVAKF
jgi:hypothetical protein